MAAVFLRSGIEVEGPSRTRDKAAKSGTVPEIPGRLEPMEIASYSCTAEIRKKIKYVTIKVLELAICG